MFFFMRLNVDRDSLKCFWDFSREELVIKDELDEGRWVDTDILKGKTKKLTTCGAISNQVELPSPLWYAEFNVTARKNGAIQCGFAVSEREEGAFSGRSMGFNRRMSALKLNFFQTTPNLTGYVLNADNEIIADISDNEESSSRRISFGNAGSRIRKYSDYLTFVGDVGELENLAGKLIIQCFGKNESVERRLFDTNIYLALESIG